MNFHWISSPSAWIGLFSLIVLELVLGVDNIVFISILSGRLPQSEQPKARTLGMVLAVIPRLLLLIALGFVLQLTKPLFHLPFPDPDPHINGNLGISGQDLIVIVGGLFLLVKATQEVHDKLEGEEDENSPCEDDDVKTKGGGFKSVIIQMMLLNIVFSLDSIITAIGIIPSDQVTVMMIAVLVATGVMAFAINPISNFVNRHPTLKMLALSFLLLIGMTLVGEGLHFHIPKGYVYFAMGFSIFAELLNIRARRNKRSPVALRRQKL